MALTDINFQEGDLQNFIVEFSAGTLNAPADILIESNSDKFPVMEIPAPAGGGGNNIFIMTD